MVEFNRSLQSQQGIHLTILEEHVLTTMDWHLVYPSAEEVYAQLIAILNITNQTQTVVATPQAIDHCLSRLPFPPSIVGGVMLLMATKNGMDTSVSPLSVTTRCLLSSLYSPGAAVEDLIYLIGKHIPTRSTAQFPKRW